MKLTSILRNAFAAVLFLAGGGMAWAQGSAMAALPAVPPGAAKAVLAGGCFWCVEADFDKVDGVLSTTSGYIGGNLANPTYDQVSNKNTGHAEAVLIVFDPKKVSYEKLVEHFWRTIDPTTKDRQFCDAGTPYRTAIFAQDAEQLRIAQASKAALEKNKPFKDPVVTEVVMGVARSTPPRNTTRTITARIRSATTSIASAADATPV